MDLAVSTACNRIHDAVDKGVAVSLIKKMQKITDEMLDATEKLRALENAAEAKSAIILAQTIFHVLESKTAKFVSSIELIDSDGEEDAIAAAKAIPLCKAEEVFDGGNKRFVREG